VPREVFSPDPTPQVVSPAPPSPILSPLWTLGVTSASLRNGDVVLYLSLPGAGDVQASAATRLAVSARASRHGHTSAHVLRFVERTLASASKGVTVAEGVPLGLTLALASAYRSRAERPDGISATVTITFSAPGHAPLRRLVQVDFRRARATHALAKQAIHRHRASAR